MTTTNDQQLDQHVRDADIYHAEQQAFFEEVDHQNWLDQMDAIHGPKDGFPIKGYTELVQPVLDAADMRFVNCMRTYSTRTVRAAHAPQVGQPVAMADIYTHGMIDAVTMANNHMMDYGAGAITPMPGGTGPMTIACLLLNTFVRYKEKFKDVGTSRLIFEGNLLVKVP